MNFANKTSIKNIHIKKKAKILSSRQKPLTIRDFQDMLKI